jgi:hypothetical protein
VTPDDEEAVRIKESALLALGRLFKETKDAKGEQKKIDDSAHRLLLHTISIGVVDQNDTTLSWACQSSQSSQIGSHFSRSLLGYGGWHRRGGSSRCHTFFGILLCLALIRVR